MNDIVSAIFEHKVVAIIRGAEPEQVLSIVQALYDGGVRLVEVTLNSKKALEMISNIRSTYDGRMLVGAGTVLNAEEAREALQAGARFIISPTLDKNTIEATKKADSVSIPGAFSPTEILNAYLWGADIVKVFPATAGPDYIKDIRGPLGHIPLMPTGGVSLENIAAFRKAGAVAFGIGSALVNTKKLNSPQSLEQISQNAQQFVSALNE
jgi:2-dehydro-3-deoxyphosphogluconate aldolase / (4S)-4-hydroxy-2-oxoglutarate aldolase